MTRQYKRGDSTMSKAKKYYAVRKGLVTGIYTSWEECQQNVNGYPGAEFKSFSTEEEAKRYLSGENEDILNIASKKGEESLLNQINEDADKLVKDALVDDNGIPKIKKGDFWFTVENIRWEDVETILDLLEEEFNQNGLHKEEKSISYGRSISLKLNSKDRIVISHYDKGDKLVMQGKPKRLFSTVLSYVTELVDVEEIPKIYNDTYKINIDKDEICSKFQYYMPNSFDKLPPKMSKTLHQAVYNLKLDGDMFDGTYLAQPVIRAIDGHLKMILIELKIIPTWKYIKENGYDMFEKVGAKYILRPDRYGKATTDQVKYISNCYTFFNSNRNELSHWDDPTAPQDTTKLLDVERAHDLIKRTLKLIDEYYE